MIRLKPLQQLRDLDTASPQFHEQLTNCLRGSEFRSAVPGLQGEDLAWLIEYLDGVSVQTILPHSALNTRAGSRWHLQSCKYHIPGTVARAQKDMRRQRGVTEIVYTFNGFSPRHSTSVPSRIRVRGKSGRFESSYQTRQDVPQGKPAGGGQGSVFSMPRFPVLER